MREKIIIPGVIGHCGSREVFMGFAQSSTLHKISFADILDESTGNGYQRRFNDRHSLDFKKYIQQQGSTTIPLTFNLRPRLDNAWNLKKNKNGTAILTIDSSKKDVLSQVDCQHRLGYLGDLDVSLAFMTFVGLKSDEEMQVFSTINGKAKGLSSSLLDFHEAQLANNLSKQKPELFISLKLNDDHSSPWYKRLDLGGKQISGMTRKASLRTMQKAVKRFIQETKITQDTETEDVYKILLDFWNAIVFLLEKEWNDDRKHFVTKGIGVYALNSLAADLYLEAVRKNKECNYSYFINTLSEFIQDFDWSNIGPLKGLGGASGATEAISMLRKLKNVSQLDLISNA